MTPRIGIVGGGFSGAMLFVQLVQQASSPLDIHFIDGSSRMPKGTAYSTWDMHHLLNVPAGKMSAFPDDASHLLRWLDEEKEHWQELLPSLADNDYEASSFLPRALYGVYIEQLFRRAMHEAKQKNITLNVHEAEATSCTGQADGTLVLSVGGQQIIVDKLALATGNPPARALNGDNVIQDFWDGSGRDFIHSPELTKLTEPVAIIGTGLTMVDAVISLHRAGLNAPIIAISRHGNLPQPHDLSAAPWQVTPPDFTSIVSAMRWLRVEVKRAAEQQISWHGVVDALRPYTVKVWHRLPVESRKCFMRHAFGWWNIHRHRMPLSSHRLLEHLQQAGELTLISARALGVEANQLRIRRRGKSQPENIAVSKVINCTGPELQLGKINNALLRQMAAQGLLTPHELGIGIVQTDDGSAEGNAKGRIFAIGPLLVGELLETTAVPELRQQAQKLAAELLAKPNR